MYSAFCFALPSCAGSCADAAPVPAVQVEPPRNSGLTAAQQVAEWRAKGHLVLILPTGSDLADAAHHS